MSENLMSSVTDNFTVTNEIDYWVDMSSSERLQYVEWTEELYHHMLGWLVEDKLVLGTISDVLFPNALDKLILKLLNYADPEDLIKNWDKLRCDRLTAMLTGPHGWAIYKAMLARLGDG